ncbi:cytochrome P450 [Pisolithus tinctorius]|nr:cytochrome P450 [Pisolithus tinctorius]
MDPSSLFESIYDYLLAVTRSATPLDFAAVIAAIWALRGAVRAVQGSFKTTRLRGPPGADLIFGASKQIAQSPDTGALYEAWTKKYGAAYVVPTTLGGKKIMLCDPRALAHFFARESWTYVFTDSTRLFYEQTFGRGVLWAEGDHKRQRKALAPAFSQGAVRNLTPIFYICAHKAKSAWEATIDAGGGDSAVIEVQSWMNHISLDGIGLAGFSHDFGALDGKSSSVTKVLDTFVASPKRSALSVGLLLLGRVFPVLGYAPTARTNLLGELQRCMEDISMELLAKVKKEKEEGVLDEKEKSIIGVLLKANDSNSDIYLTHAEVLAQMRGLLIVGYETMSITLTWALLELAGNPDIQNKLRQELVMFGEEPTYDQLQSSLPYLDAVLHETLRVHPALIDIVRVATEDDIIPLSELLITESGEVVNSITVARGTHIGIPVSCVNRSTRLWGEDAMDFRPERWLEKDGIPKKAQDIQAYRHILTFMEGPRICVGKGFALTEFKAVMSVLVRNFVFEMRDGPDTRVELSRGLLLRPRIVGEQGINVPLRVRRYEG